MTDHHLDAKAWEVRALLDGRKTMTRRLAALPPKKIGGRPMTGCVSPWQRVQPGDRLWVRENFRETEGGVIRDGAGGQMDYIEPSVEYMADGIPSGRRWTPSIHMPRWASRLTLVVTAKKIERLQEISDDDSLAEGVDLNGAVAGHDFNIDHEWWPGGPRRQFERLWRSLHGPDSWDANPEVIALTFRVVRANVDSAEARAA